MESFCSQAYTSKGLLTLKPHSESEIYTYIFKGYPNLLKQKLIEKVSSSVKCDTAYTYDYNGCPISILCKEKGFRIIDGTFPNTTEPETYGINDSIIDFSAFQDSTTLQKRKSEVIFLFKEIKKEEKRCTGFLTAAKGIINDCKRYESPYINKPMLNRFAAELWKKHGTAPSGHIGKEKKFFAEVLNKNGVDFPVDKFSSMCERVNIINDFSSAVSACIADKIRLYALSCGFDVLTFVDFLDAETVRHIIIPQLKYGFYTAECSPQHKIENSKRIKKSRFYIQGYNDSFKKKKQFCQKAYSELIEEASKSLNRIEKLRYKLDQIYLSATNINEFLNKNELKVTIFDKSLQKVYNTYNHCV